MKIGLKLWSINTEYIPIANELFRENVFQYIELFAKPGSENYLSFWRSLSIPFILHAPHSYTGINFSKRECFDENVIALKTVDIYSRVLKPQFIIFHPGIDGNVKETVHQIGIMKEKYPEVFSIAIIENKPAVGLKNEKCIGALFEEISLIINETSLGFCLDFGHAICAAYSFKKPWKNYIEKLIDLKPDIFHISDGHTNSPIDEHLNIGDGDYDFDFILSKLQSESLVSLETKKKSSSNLDDFRNDSLSLKRYIA